MHSEEEHNVTTKYLADNKVDPFAKHQTISEMAAKSNEQLCTLINDVVKAHQHSETAALYAKLAEVGRIYQEREAQYEKKVAELSYRLKQNTHDGLIEYLRTVKPYLTKGNNPIEAVKEVIQYIFEF